MNIEEPFQITSRHWLYALLFALVVHLAFFLAYKSNQQSGSKETKSTSLVVNLKKITFPPYVKPPPIVQPRVEPLPKPKPKEKPIVKPKPILEAKPSPIVKSVEIHQPTVEPLQYANSAQATNENVELNLSLRRSYESQLLAWLERHKKYPHIARRRNQQGTVTLEFTINAEGRLLSHKIIQASAHPALNSAVQKMIKSASPLPSVPEELRKNRMKFTYTIPVHFILKK